MHAHTHTRTCIHAHIKMENNLTIECLLAVYCESLADEKLNLTGKVFLKKSRREIPLSQEAGQNPEPPALICKYQTILLPPSS